ncbi:hypothetical protein L218DRAFT_676926 [Marasmius fiardii PR-910]|nr:hypothetical protein L218DRAFT_676926 [Marasmius fiardii PR-910]
MFNERHGLGIRTWVDISLPVSKKPVVLLKVTTNYRTSLSPDALLDLCEDVESSFGKRGRRYISNANKFFWNDYCISLRRCQLPFSPSLICSPYNSHCCSQEEEED